MTNPRFPSPALLDALATEAARNDPEGLFPDLSFDLLAEAGLIDIVVAAEGRHPLSLREALDIVVAVSERDPAVGLLLSFHYAIVNGIQTPQSPWPLAARQKVLEGVRQRGELINNIIAEPELGGQTFGGRPATTLTPLANGNYALSGHKIYATGISRIRWATMPASFANDPDRRASVLVDTTKSGISTRPTWDTLGMRTTRSDDLLLDAVEITPDDILEISDIKAPRSLLNDGVLASWTQILMPSIYHGVALAARNWFARFLHDRVPAALGKPLATLDKFQEIFGEIDRLLSINRALFDRALAAAETGDDDAATATAVLRVSVIRHVRQITNAIVEVSGNRALQRDDDFERHFRNAVHASVHSPNIDQITKVIGQRGLKSRP